MKIRSIKITIPLPGLAKILFGDHEATPIRAGPSAPEYEDANRELARMSREEKERASGN